MGFFSNMVISQLVERHNDRHIHLRTTQIDRPLKEIRGKSIYVFGGREGKGGERAHRFRMDLIEACVSEMSNERVATILLVREREAAALDALYDDNPSVLRVGRDIAWQLFDARNRQDDVRRMFEEIVWAYCRGTGEVYYELLTWVQFFLDLLTTCLSGDFFTYYNMNLMVSKLVLHHDASAFLNWVSSNARAGVPEDMYRRLAALWRKGLSHLIAFWNTLTDETRSLSAAGTIQGTFNDCLRSGSICLCPVPDIGRSLAAAILLAQLRAIGRRGRDICLIDYQAKLPTTMDNCLLNDVSEHETCCIIGQSPSSLSIADDMISASSETAIICMGMAKQADVRVVHGMMSGISRVTMTNWGLGHGGFLSFGKAEMSDIKPDQLRIENRCDGSAVVRDSSGYRIIGDLVI